MGKLKMDSRRRITLPKELIDDPMQEFVAIKVDGDILLKPLPKDPIKALQEEGKKIPDHVTFEDMKNIAEKAVWEDAQDDLRRIGFFSGADKKQ